MRFVFRADGSASIGLGHVSRVSALARAAMRAGVDACVVSSRPTPSVAAFIARAGVTLHAIDCEPGTTEDADATLALAPGGSRVVVDGYVFGPAFLSSLRRGGRLVAYIDDLASQTPPVDLLLNPNVSGSPADYVVPAGTTALIGPTYAIVDDHFLAARGAVLHRPRVERVEKVLVTMGGVDPPGASLRVIAALERFDQTRFDVRIVVGSGNPRRGEIIAAAAACTQHSVKVRVDVADMAAEMTWADLAVVSSGVTATELSCVGVPGLAFAIVDNQRLIADALARLGMFEVLPFCGGSAEEITTALARVAADPDARDAMVSAQRATIDGKGKERVVERLLAIGQPGGHTSDLSGGHRG